MKDFWDRQKSQALVYKLAIAFVIFYSLDSICTAIVSVMMDVEWKDLSATQKLLKECLVLKAWCSTMLAFFTNISKKAANNELPFQNPPANAQVTTTNISATVQTTDGAKPEV